MKVDASRPNSNEMLRLRRLLEKMYETMIDHTEISRTNHEFIKGSPIFANESKSTKPISDQMLLDSDEFIKLMKISKSTYYRMKNDNVIRPIKIRGRDYFTTDEINRIFKKKV